MQQEVVQSIKKAGLDIAIDSETTFDKYHIYQIRETGNIYENMEKVYIKDNKGITVLQKFYEDQNKYSFPFQMMAYISRLSLLKEAMRGDYDVIITERCIFTDQRVFAKMLYDSKKIEEIDSDEDFI